MSLDPRGRAEVTITVDMGDQCKTFTADTTTTGDLAHAAEQILLAVKEDARNWISKVGRSA